MLKEFYPYRSSLPRTSVHTQILRGEVAYFVAKKLFGDKMDNHVGGIWYEHGKGYAIHFSDNTLRLNCSALIAGDCNKELSTLSVIWEE